MNLLNIKTAFQAFWVIALNAPHIYCDNDRHSIVGTNDTVENQINLLLSAVNAEIEQEEFLDDMKKMIP